MAEKLGMSTGKGYHSGIYDDYATKARRLQSIVINSYADLIGVLEECGYYGTYAIAINEKEISLPNSAGTLPIWHSGIMVADTDASLTLTGHDGNIVSAYYDKTADTWSVQTFDKTKNCLWKWVSSIYSAPLQSAENVFTSNTEKALDLSEYVDTLKNKKLIIEICNCYYLSNATPPVQISSFLTNLFAMHIEGSSFKFQQNINGVNFWFRTDGATLYFNNDNSESDLISAYYINAIYEEN